jgi:hypothetical protein
MTQWPPPGSFASQSFGKRIKLSDLGVLTTDHLEFCIASIIERKIKAGHDIHPSGIAYTLSIALLKYFLGSEWAWQNLRPVQPDPSKIYHDGRKFLKTDHPDQDADSNHRHIARITGLASALFNFQSTLGIAHRITELKRGTLESGLGELECARLVSASRFQLKFVIPRIGRPRGENYDIEFVSKSGLEICCEIESKAETTTLTEKTIYDTFEHARKQLPKGKPGLVFLRLPESWMKHAECEMIAIKAAQDKFRQSNRLVLILLMWERWRRENGDSIASYGFTAIPNQKSIYYSDDISQTLCQADSFQNDAWVNLIRFIGTKLPVIGPAVIAMNQQKGSPDHPQ